MDDTQAWALIDRALPQALRGGLSETNLSPVRLGPEIRHEFATGAIVTLTGDPDRRTWTQIEIIGRGLQEHWDPRLRSEA